GAGKKTKVNEDVIKASFSTALQFELGYDFVRSPMFNLYPYAGVGLRIASLRYETPLQTNSPFSNLTDLVQNNGAFYESVTGLGYQAGIGAEVALSKRGSLEGTLLFVKAGINRA